MRQGDAGSSMFVILSGRVRVVIEPSGQEVAVIEPGGFFGEMSMLTGDPRTATVRAASDVHALEIPAERFRDTALARPGLRQLDRPVLIVQGASDPFGMPPEGPGRELVVLKGNHSLSSDVGGLRSAVHDWLARLLHR